MKKRHHVEKTERVLRHNCRRLSNTLA